MNEYLSLNLGLATTREPIAKRVSTDDLKADGRSQGLQLASGHSHREKRFGIVKALQPQ